MRNLPRGYGLRLPTGQAVARHLGLPVLTASELQAAAASPQQAQVLRAGGFLERTPLWYYLLAEAKHHGGQRLGPVGSTLIAEVLTGRCAAARTPSCARLAGSPPSQQPSPVASSWPTCCGSPRSWGAAHGRGLQGQAGRHLSKIAEQQLGDVDRWPEIFVLNRAKIRHRHRISIGQVLTLPATPLQPPPRLYKVRRGDTLSKILEQQLGDANRWPEIFRLNRDISSDPNRITPGQVLVILPSWLLVVEGMQVLSPARMLCCGRCYSRSFRAKGGKGEDPSLCLARGIVLSGASGLRTGGATGKALAARL